jgi:hypothetical protein
VRIATDYVYATNMWQKLFFWWGTDRTIMLSWHCILMLHNNYVENLNKVAILRKKLLRSSVFLPSFCDLEFLHPISKSGAIPLLGKVGKLPMFVVFGASSVSARIQAQPSNRSATLIFPKNWKFQQHPLTSRDHYFRTNCRMRAC